MLQLFEHYALLSIACGGNDAADTQPQALMHWWLLQAACRCFAAT
jgi:hypothetical protein